MVVVCVGWMQWPMKDKTQKTKQTLHKNVESFIIISNSRDVSILYFSVEMNLNSMVLERTIQITKKYIVHNYSLASISKFHYFESHIVRVTFLYLQSYNNTLTFLLFLQPLLFIIHKHWKTLLRHQDAMAKLIDFVFSYKRCTSLYNSNIQWIDELS